MRIGFLTASGTVGIDGLLDPRNRGVLYEVACLVPATKNAVPRNLHDRRQHDRKIAALLQSAGVDTVFAVGYPYILTEPMLEAFPERIIAVHNGDLTDLDPSGRRRWAGPHPVLDAILGGVRATRTSMYVITRDVGHGPLLLVGPHHPVASLAKEAIAAGDFSSVRQYARLHSEWMRRSWGMLIEHAIEMLAAGNIRIVGDTAWIDGAPGACRLGDAPDICQELGERIRRDVPASCPFIQR